jgi:hypothetical protein
MKTNHSAVLIKWIISSEGNLYSFSYNFFFKYDYWRTISKGSAKLLSAIRVKFDQFKYRREGTFSINTQ